MILHLCKSRLIFGLLLAMIVANSLTFSVELTGSLTSELYTWTEDRAEHLRPYQRLNSNVKLYQSDQNIKVDWYTNLRWVTDLIDQLDADPQLNVYQSYFRVAGFYKNSELRLGRQFVYNSIGSAFIDGFQLRNFTISDYSIDLYAGSRVNRLDPADVRSFADFLNVGSRLKWRINDKYKLIQSFKFTRENGYWDKILSGLSLRAHQGSKQGLVRLVYDHYDNKIHSLSGRISIPKNNWRFTIEAGSTQPILRANSLFSLVNFSKREEIRLTTIRKLAEDFRLTGSFKTSLKQGNNSNRIAIGLKSNRYYLIWTNLSGDQSSNNGVRAGGRLSIYDSWHLFVSGGYNSYLVQDEHESDLTAWHMRAGFSKQVSKTLQVSSEIQIISNAITKQDTRLLFSLSKFFDMGGDHE